MALLKIKNLIFDHIQKALNKGFEVDIIFFNLIRIKISVMIMNKFDY